MFFTSFYTSKLAESLRDDKFHSVFGSTFFFFFLTFVLNSLRFQKIALFWNFKLSVSNSLFILSLAFIILTLY